MAVFTRHPPFCLKCCAFCMYGFFVYLFSFSHFFFFSPTFYIRIFFYRHGRIVIKKNTSKLNRIKLNSVDFLAKFSWLHQFRVISLVCGLHINKLIVNYYWLIVLKPFSSPPSPVFLSSVEVNFLTSDYFSPQKTQFGKSEVASLLIQIYIDIYFCRTETVKLPGRLCRIGAVILGIGRILTPPSALESSAWASTPLRDSWRRSLAGTVGSWSFSEMHLLSSN